MPSRQQFQNPLSRTIRGTPTSALAIAIVFALMVGLTQSAQAQTYKVIYNFTGGQDGANPGGSLTRDGAGNFYGTAGSGGNLGGNCGTIGCGTVFKLSNKGSGWILSPLYAFTGGDDAATPGARVTIGPDGGFYGTTAYGGGRGCSGNGCGTVYNLRPPVSACKTALCPWTETILHTFTGGIDGAHPGHGDLIFDAAGDIYGTSSGGGIGGWGTVYELVKSNSYRTLNVVYDFTGGSDGGRPFAGVIFDNTGNLYGTTYEGGQLSCGGSNYGCGTVFQLTRSLGSSWAETTLYSFQAGSDGAFPFGGLVFDKFHKLYGSTEADGSGGGGTVFMLSPSNGSWTFALRYSLSGPGRGAATGPLDSLVMDTAGNLYGTTYGDDGAGTVFKLTPAHGGWTYTLLHDFTGGSDGGGPAGSVIFDAHGNLYGTAEHGGKGLGCGESGCGVMWEITP